MAQPPQEAQPAQGAERLFIRVDGQEPFFVLEPLGAVLEAIESALTNGTVLRWDTDQGSLLLNGRTASSVVVTVERQAASSGQVI